MIVVKWLGHASFIVKAEGQTIYIDPYEGEYHEKANLVLVTHSHHDHCDSSQISKIRGNHTIIVAPADCASTIGGQVRTLKPGEKATFGPIAVTATAAYNSKRFRSPGNPYHPKGFGVGYLITAGGKTVYHAGDTDRIPEMDQLGKVDLALLPSGGTYTMTTWTRWKQHSPSPPRWLSPCIAGTPIQPSSRKALRLRQQSRSSR